ncbi:MAG: putative two-component system response regulator [Myxococcota bacterium]|jgi:putative two-component system response regulator
MTEHHKILIVEDDLDYCTLLKAGLTQKGYDVTVTRDARSALHHMALESFDVVVSDLGLPGMRGDELLLHIRSIDQNLPFLMLTGENDVNTAVKAVQNGADEYLMKPASVSTVTQHIASAIRRRGEAVAKEKKIKDADMAEVRAFLTGVQALVNSLEAKDKYTRDHSKKVATFAVMMAREIPGITKLQIREIRIGAWLHDIGKIAVPLDILHNQGKLNEEEWEVVKQHTIHGAKILEPLSKNYPEVQRIVRGEHERWDGKGYPDGLAGEDIPLGSRLVMIADTYDAICSNRPYRKALSSEDALKIIQDGAGTQFDPNLVPLFEKTYKQFPAATASPEPQIQ